MKAQEAIAVLRRPLSAEEIEWKIIASKNGQTTIAPFIDARAVMARLDEAFGPFGWQVRYTPAQVGEEHGVIASIAVKNPDTGEWVEKQDGSGATDLEPFKGGISGALKRAAVAWGIGRELYKKEGAWGSHNAPHFNGGIHGLPHSWQKRIRSTVIMMSRAGESRGQGREDQKGPSRDKGTPKGPEACRLSA